MNPQKSRLGMSSLGTAVEDCASNDPQMPESYQAQVKVRSDLQRPMPVAVALAPEAGAEGMARQALPAWIRTQVEQLEMRRTARLQAAMPRLVAIEEGD